MSSPMSTSAAASRPMFMPALCAGEVLHRRLAPVGHAFRYPAYFLCLPLSWFEAASPLRCPALLGIDRRKPFSVLRRDHGARDGSSLDSWIRELLRANGLQAADGEVVLYTLPRVLGYAFNPVSFWMCHDRAGALRAVLCEVSNTFGEHHNYLVSRDDGGVIGTGQSLSARKVFHVSPFFPVDGEYRFRFHAREQRCLFRIDYLRDGVLQLTTSLSGRSASLGSSRLVFAFLRLPWLMAGVIVRIHLQALRLWLKGAVFHRKPAPPVETTTR